MYIEKDIPALKMRNGKLWWKRKTYDDFAKLTCRLKPKEIDQIFSDCVQAVSKAAKDLDAYIIKNPDAKEFAKKLKNAWQKQLATFGFEDCF